MRSSPLALLACLCLVAASAATSPAHASLDGAPAMIAGGLQTPWDVLPLTDGRTLITELPGRIRVIGADGALQAAPVYADPSARKLLGLEPHPEFAANGLLYLYVSRPEGSSVVRLRDTGMGLVLDRVVFPGPIGTDGAHDGGRMRFGPDGKLYVTTGDIHNPDLPQNLESLNGKILRMNPDGSAPADNPFFGEGPNARFVWSFGHRHPQGLAWDDRGRLWQTEHGPSGEQYDPARYPGGAGRCCRDELNLISKGGNYGWPVISGDDARAGMITPVANSGTTTAWAPGGLAFAADGKLYAPMLRDQHLHQFTLDAGSGVAEQRELYRGTFGRLRAATYDPCRNALWFTGDGLSAAVYRVAVGLEGRAAPTCGTAAPAAPASAGVPPVTAPRPSPALARGAADPAAAARRMAARGATALRAVGLARLARGRRVVLRGGGFGPGRLSVRLSTRTGPRQRPLAAATRRVASRATVAVSLRLTARGRQAVRRATRRTLTLTVAFRPRGGGKPIIRSAATRVARGGARPPSGE